MSMDSRNRNLAIAGLAFLGLLVIRRIRRRRRFHDEQMKEGGYNEKIQHNPPVLYNSAQSYSHVVIARGCHPIQPAIIMISGQVAFDENKALIGGNDKKAQARKAFLNLRSAIESSGATVNDVVKITTYVVDYKEEDIDAIQEGANLCFGQGNRKFASTVVGVQALARPNLLIEVEAMAIINTGSISKELDNCAGKKGRCGGGWKWGWGKKCGGRKCDKNSCDNSGSNRSEKEEKVNK